MSKEKTLEDRVAELELITELQGKTIAILLALYERKYPKEYFPPLN